MKLRAFSMIGVVAASMLTLAGTAHASEALSGKAYGQLTGMIYIDGDLYSPPLTLLQGDPDTNPNRAAIYEPSDAPSGAAGCDYGTLSGTVFNSSKYSTYPNLSLTINPSNATYSFCRLKGFAWNDSIGWIAFDGAHPDLASFLPHEVDKARVLYSTSDGNFNIQLSGQHVKPLAGYVWSENAGWISLASDPINGTTKITSQQDGIDWGVYLDTEALYSASPGSLNLKGYALSEKLGWIKFGSETGDNPTFGATSFWIPDITPPTLYAQNDAWFAAQGSDTVVWPDFMEDAESAVKKDLLINTTNPSSCGTVSTTHVQELLSAGSTSLNIPGAGSVRAGALNGYCSYTISGGLQNNVGMKPVGGVSLVMNVRAGQYSHYDTITPGDSVIADGTETSNYLLSLYDSINNPIVPVTPLTCSSPCPGKRIVELDVEYANAMNFNTLVASPPVPEGSLTPVNLNDFPLSETDTVKRISEISGGAYRMRVASYAPTEDANEDKLELKKYKLKIVDDPIPAVSLKSGAPNPSVPGGTVTPTDNLDIWVKRISDSSGEPHKPTFRAPVVIAAGTVNEGKPLTPGVPAEMTFDVRNLSHNDIGQSAGSVSVDTGYDFYDQGGNDESTYLELTNIHPGPFSSGSLYAGRFDPLNIRARYELFNGTGDVYPISAGSTPMHNASNNYDPEPYTFNEALDGSGVYSVPGIYGLEPGTKLEEGETVPDLQIQRSMPLSDTTLNLAGTGAPESTRTVLLSFTPEHWIGENYDTVKMRVRQLIGYRYASQPLHTLIRPTAPAAFDGADLQAIGIEYTGSATGREIYETSGRTQNVVGAAGIKQLKEAFRRNVADLTQGGQASSCSPPFQALNGMLANTGGCIANDGKGSVTAFYKGQIGDTLVLGSTGPVTIPKNTRYTLIVSGGANVLLKNNLVYETPGTSSLGLIVLADDQGLGGNVLISPTPTDLVGNLYAEGSLMSVTDDSVSGSIHYYYGETSPRDTRDLKNQLYWKGSLISRNTIGGSPRLELPDGISASLACPNAPVLNCSQRFDLDYLRRFSVKSGVPVGGGVRSLTLAAGTSDQPFYVERDPILDQLPPPGFTTQTSLGTKQEIR